MDSCPIEMWGTNSEAHERTTATSRPDNSHINQDLADGQRGVYVDETGDSFSDENESMHAAR